MFFSATLVAVALAQMPRPVTAATATASTKDMYKFWCPTHETSIICQHHKLSAAMMATTDTNEKKAITEQIRALLKPKTTPTEANGMPRQPSPVGKEFQAMKMAYCASNPTGSKLLCSTAASQYKGAPNTPMQAQATEVTDGTVARKVAMAIGKLSARTTRRDRNCSLRCASRTWARRRGRS